MAKPKRSGNPSVRAGASAPSSPTREAVSARSRGLLVWMSQLPKLVVPVTMLVLMLVGLMAPLVAAVPALLVILAFVLWLAYLSWPVLDTRGRALRGVLVGAVVFALVGRISGWL